jgi:hypothetical protein
MLIISVEVRASNAGVSEFEAKNVELRALNAVRTCLAPQYYLHNIDKNIVSLEKSVF